MTHGVGNGSESCHLPCSPSCYTSQFRLNSPLCSSWGHCCDDWREHVGYEWHLREGSWVIVCLFVHVCAQALEYTLMLSTVGHRVTHDMVFAHNNTSPRHSDWLFAWLTNPNPDWHHPGTGCCLHWSWKLDRVEYKVCVKIKDLFIKV